VPHRVSLGWLAVLAGVWWVLAFPRTDAWGAGGLAVLVGVLLHTALGGRAGGRLHVRGAVAFAPFFLAQSIRGGFDVARRALTPSLPLAPAFLEFRTRLPEGAPRVLFVNCISLLPGTFSAEVTGERVKVHLLAREDGAEERLARLEAKVAGLFGLSIPERAG
jgi:multicomponent Na+:H+ antiporter subunit E